MRKQRPDRLCPSRDQQSHADTGLPLCQGDPGGDRRIRGAFRIQLLLEPGIRIGQIDGVVAIDGGDQSSFLDAAFLVRNEFGQRWNQPAPTSFKASVHWAITNGFWTTSVAATSSLAFFQRGSSGVKAATPILGCIAKSTFFHRKPINVPRHDGLGVSDCQAGDCVKSYWTCSMNSRGISNGNLSVLRGIGKSSSSP